MKEKTVGRPKKMPLNYSDIEKVIQKNQFATLVQLAEYYGVHVTTLCRSEFHEQITKDLHENRMYFVNRVDMFLFQKIESGQFTAADAKLFYKRYGNKEVRDSLKENTVIEMNKEYITKLEDLE